jgi:DnaA-like protein
MIRHNESVRLTIDPCTPRPLSEPYVTPQLKRAIAARWKEWVPWVRLLLLRAHQSDPAVDATEDGADSRRLHQHHSDHILDMLRAGISMRTIRRHRLDDPRLANEVRAVLVQAARERQSKAWFRRSEEQREQDRLATLIKLGSVANLVATKGPDCETHDAGSHPGNVVLDPLALPAAIQSIRRQVCEHFYLREMRDPELTVRSHRRAYVLPRQIAMYLARQVTGASLQEIGREFGGRHHTTVLHSINRIEEMRRFNKSLDHAIDGRRYHAD